MCSAWCGGDPVILVALPQVDLGGDLLGAETPRRSDDAPVVHLATGALGERSLMGVHQAGPDLQACHDGPVAFGHGPREPPDEHGRPDAFGGYREPDQGARQRGQGAG
jgi:hypothetical protein